MNDKYRFLGCVRMVNGILFPLEFKPTSNGENYFTHKSNYTVNGFMFHNTTLYIYCIDVSYPNSVHNNRVWRNFLSALQSNIHFSSDQHLIKDSSFSPSERIVYKKPHLAEFGRVGRFFNNKFAKARIKTEHYICLLKKHFPYLKKFCINIAGTENMEKLVKQTIAVSVLYNFLVKLEALLDNIVLTYSDESESRNKNTTIIMYSGRNCNHKNK